MRHGFALRPSKEGVLCSVLVFGPEGISVHAGVVSRPDKLKKRAAMVERIDIERALSALTSDEGGMVFQRLAVVLAKLRYPELAACERKNDLGLDAYASAALCADGRGKGMASSLTQFPGQPPMLSPHPNRTCRFACG
ncbi:MAG: hypothetical protein LC126_23875 [Bryobacterales bacterium]|nr:hypothetical protein [Bryobacterales bacterium]